MRILLILLLIFGISSGQNLIEIEKNCPPCNVSKNKLDYVKSQWLSFAPGDLIKVNSLTQKNILLQMSFSIIIGQQIKNYYMLIKIRLKDLKCNDMKLIHGG